MLLFAMKVHWYPNLLFPFAGKGEICLVMDGRVEAIVILLLILLRFMHLGSRSCGPINLAHGSSQRSSQKGFPLKERLWEGVEESVVGMNGEDVEGK